MGDDGEAARGGEAADVPPCEELVAKCLSLGLVMQRAPSSEVSLPAVTLQPTTMPVATYSRLLKHQALWNEAVDRIARNFTFLREVLAETAASDRAFTGRLLEILDAVYLTPPSTGADAAGVASCPVYQRLMLGIFRTDYMKHEPAAPTSTPPVTAKSSVPSKGRGAHGRGRSTPAPSATEPAAVPAPRSHRRVLNPARGKPVASVKGGNSDAAPKSAKKRKPLAKPSVAALDVEADVASWKNVEINTISCSFAGLSKPVGCFHEYLLKRRACMQVAVDRSPAQEADRIAFSEAESAVPESIAMAVQHWKKGTAADAFIRRYAADNQGTTLRPVVVVVIQENERNTADQYRLLFRLLESHSVPSIRRTLGELAVGGGRTFQLVPSHRADTAPFAVIEQQYVAAVFYFRSTYVPQDFPTEAAWAMRADMERSNAIKCPSIPHHLMTFKKIQQVMCDVDGVLAPIAFNGDRAKAEAMASHFMPQYSLNPLEPGNAARAESIIQEALEFPERFVLKPQLEGGGNLISGEEMRRVLSTAPATDPVTGAAHDGIHGDAEADDAAVTEREDLYWKVRKEYILMRRIEFPRRTGSLLRNGERLVLENNLCSELGIFGVILSNGAPAGAPSGPPAARPRRSASGVAPTPKAEVEFIFNRGAGYVVRSKPADVDDGGVMAGVAALDSLLLTQA